MEKQGKKDKELSINDIRGAMAEEHPDHDVSVAGASAMTSDMVEEQQPDGTYRFALNGVMEDKESAMRLQNEESFAQCQLLPKVSEKGLLYIGDCCKKLLRVEYTEETIEDIINNFIVSCECQTHNGNWIVDNDDEMTTEELIEFLMENAGTHRAVPVCVHEEFTIIINTCCGGEIRKTECSPYELEYQEILDLFGCDDYLVLIGDGNGHVVNINGVDYAVSDFPITISNDAEVNILCTFRDGCGIMQLFTAEADMPYDGGNTVDLSFVTSPPDYVYIKTVPVFDTEDSVYICFHNTDMDWDRVSSIRVNGVPIPRAQGYDDTIPTYWYVNQNDSTYIFVKFNIPVSGIYTIQIWADDLCVNPAEYHVEIRRRIPIIDSVSGNPIGYFDPVSISTQIISNNVNIDGTWASSLVGRTYNLQTIDYYIVNDGHGNTFAVSVDILYIDIRYNNYINVHLV